MIAHVTNVGAKLEGMFAPAPGEVVEHLDNIAVLHRWITTAGDHKASDIHIRRRGDRIGSNALNAGLGEIAGRRPLQHRVGLVDAIKTGAELIHQGVGNSVVMREGNTLVGLRVSKGAGDRRTCVNAIAGAIWVRRSDDGSGFVGTAYEHGLLGRKGIIQPYISLVAGDGRRVIHAIVVLVVRR